MKVLWQSYYFLVDFFRDMINIKTRYKKEEGLYPRRKIYWRRTPPESPSPLPSSRGLSLD
jgi:hypothetical protein